MTWAWASPACSTSSPRRNVSRLCWVIMYVIRTNLYLPYCSHGQLSSHHWRGVRHTHHWGGRQKDQATDLGHSGSGAIQGSDTLLLPWSSWCADGLRYYQAVSEASYYLRNCFTTWPFQLHLQSPEQLANRHSQSHQSQHCDLSHWQQIGSGEHSGGYLRGGQGVCRRERPNVSRSERYDVSFNWKHSVWAYTDYLFFIAQTVARMWRRLFWRPHARFTRTSRRVGSIWTPPNPEFSTGHRSRRELRWVARLRAPRISARAKWMMEPNFTQNLVIQINFYF